MLVLDTPKEPGIAMAFPSWLQELLQERFLADIDLSQFTKRFKSRRYQVARFQAMARSGGMCQLCGHVPATETHHWAPDRVPNARVVPDDLTALCTRCHELAHVLRRHEGLDGPGTGKRTGWRREAQGTDS